ncbi:MAG: OmpA family protein [Cyanobacteria bacterium P01_A01_bin.40]
MSNSNQKNSILQVLLASLTGCSLCFCLGQAVFGQNISKSYQVLVNSDRDGAISPDQELTLRESVALVNNTLAYQDLSPSERQQVKRVNQPDASRIEFDFPAPVTIELLQPLPPLVSPGLVIDGTTHPKYDPSKISTQEIPIPIPVVALTTAPGKQVFRGLTVSGDRITVKGLSIYGFDQRSEQTNFATDTTPGADIVISARLPYDNRKMSVDKKPPEDVTIADNWLGLPPDEALNHIPSSFGVWLFDGINTKIQGNRISYHGGSGIVTSTNARQTQIFNNIIVGNGLTGMPHAIYLEGKITDSLIADNLVCGNDGSGIYLFKPEGKITVKNNEIKFNGRRVPSAAVYLMGNNHQILDNQIEGQTGTGVTIAAYPKSDRNLINNNSFNNLQGLSIDLNTRNHTPKPYFKLGDGVNPPRNSPNRRRDTANRAINAPEFLSEDFYIIDGKVRIDGVADPGAKITLYQVDLGMPRDLSEHIPLASQSLHYGPLSAPLTNTNADQDGKFSFTLDNPLPGTTISAIATKAEDGTSEPAFNAVINSLEKTASSIPPSMTIPSCTTKPLAQASLPPAISKVPLNQPVTLRVPTNIHFALDRSVISDQSKEILKQIAVVMQQHPFLTIELQGHTDSRASDQYNLALSKQRAISARNYLMQQGVQPEKMTINPLGESKLKKPGNTSLEHAYNRRVEIKFQDQRDINIIFEEQNLDLQLEK